MNTNKKYVPVIDSDTTIEGRDPSSNHIRNRVRKKIWWGWSTELNSSFET